MELNDVLIDALDGDIVLDDGVFINLGSDTFEGGCDFRVVLADRAQIGDNGGVEALDLGSIDSGDIDADDFRSRDGVRVVVAIAARFIEDIIGADEFSGRDLLVEFAFVWDFIGQTDGIKHIAIINFASGD